MAVIYGYNLSFKTHASPAVKIIIGEEPVSVSFHPAPVNAQGILVKANMPHKVKSGKGLVISVYIDSHSEVGIEFNSLIRNGILKLSDHAACQLLEYFRKGLENHLTEADIKISILAMLLINTMHESTMVLDERVKKVIHGIKSSLNHNIKFSDLVRISALSESRLIHLFKKEVGITIRKYILWCRIQKALKAMSSGSNIKRSAELAGFTDAAHLSRTFASMVGVSPSSMLK